MTRMLLVDTCTERGLVAFGEDSEVLQTEHLPAGLQNSSALLPAVERGMASLGWTTDQIDVIAVTVGPGSYTGIRVGAAVGQSMAFAKQVPLVGVCSLHGFVPAEDGKYAAAIDAKIGGVYLLMAEKKGSEVTVTRGPELLSLENLKEGLGDVKHLVTPKAKRLQGRIEELEPDLDLIWEEANPRPEFLQAQVMRKLAAGDYRSDGRLQLLYLRKTQAEIEHEAKCVD